MKKIFCIVISAALLLALSACAQSQQITPEYVLTYADNQPQNYPTTLGAERFAKLVEQRTEGRVVIQLKFGGDFGTEEEVLTQLRFGGIDFARLSLASMTDELPRLNVLQMPFLFEDAAHMWRVMDGSVGEEFLQLFSQIGLVGLSWYDAGARSFYSDEVEIRSPADLQGLTVRVQDSRVVIDMITLLGAEPVTFSYSDVYYAFETGKIDVAENNWPAYHMMEHYKVAGYYTADEHSRVPEIQLASDVTWQKLPEEYRDIIVQCAKESALYERELWIDQQTASRAAVLEQGCTEITLTEEERAAFRQAVQPLYDLYCADEVDLIRRIQQS